MTMVGPGRRRQDPPGPRGRPPARSAAGGVWLVRLDAVDAAAVLAQVVAETLHVPGGEAALRDRLAGADDRAAARQLRARRRGRGRPRRLAARRGAAAAGARDQPGAAGFDGEHVYAARAAVARRVGRAVRPAGQAMRRQSSSTPTPTRSVEEVCRSLDGLPLAIELAAARVRSLSVRDIARRLDDRFALLQDPSSHRRSGGARSPARSAGATTCCSPTTSAACGRCPASPASASLDAVEHVLVALGVPDGAVVDTVTRLVDRSLVSVGRGGGRAVRYRLLDSIRAYAATGCASRVSRRRPPLRTPPGTPRRPSWCDAHVRSDRQPECLAIARAERANIDAALAWCAANDPGARRPDRQRVRLDLGGARRRRRRGRPASAGADAGHAGTRTARPVCCSRAGSRRRPGTSRWRRRTSNRARTSRKQLDDEVLRPTSNGTRRSWRSS